jgi:hypothetical protein
MCQTNCIGKVETRNLYAVTFSDYCTVYEIMWKNVVESDRPQMTIQYGACASRAG